MTDDENLCAEMVRIQDPLRFLSAMTAPPDQRAALLVLYAFNLEIAKAPWASQEEMLAEMRLQWWLDQVAEIYDNDRVSPHMVMTPLAKLVQKYNLPRPVLEAMITARRWDIYKQPFADMADFEQFIQDTAGGLLLLSCQVLAPSELPEAEHLAAHAYSRGVAAWLLAVPYYLEKGRVPLVEMSPDGIKEIAQNAHYRGDNARNCLFKYHKSIIPALRAGWWAPQVLRRASKHPDRVFQGGLTASDARLRAGLIWKTIIGNF
jgi:hypothetical protein